MRSARPPCRPAVRGLLALLLAGCGPGEPAGPPLAEEEAPAALFREVAAEAGLGFFHFNGRTGDLRMAEVMGGGVALLDYDGDGDLDVFFVQGGMLEPDRPVADALDPPRHPLPLADRLYRNDLYPGDGKAEGALRFTDVTAASGLGDLPREGYGMGVAAGDYDGDGWTDLYVTRLGPDQLLRNRGDGTFEDATARAGAGDERWNVPATFFDYDADGDLDLFVGAYLAYDPEQEPRCSSLLGRRDYCGASHFEPLPDRLLRNRGDGTFEDVTAAAGLAAAYGPALGALAADLDEDGRLDLYVANDAAANNFWHNRGDGTFEDRALLAGLAVNGAGRPEAGMGVDAGDYDGDGDLDLFLTHLITETNTLYRNDGGGLFSDRTDAAGLGAVSRGQTFFGTGWVDFDGDGRLDLAAGAGAVQILEPLVQRGDPFPLHEPNHLLRNLGPEGGEVRFEEVSAGAGPAWSLSEVTRGLAFGDLDDDGDLDLVAANNGGPARLLLREGSPEGPWLGVRLRDSREGDAPGAVATLHRREAPPLLRRVRIDGSYAAAHDPRLIFGLGTSSDLLRLEVRWSDGSKESFPPPPPGRYSEVRQGGGRKDGAGKGMK